MSDDRPNDTSSDQGGTPTPLDEKTFKALDKYIETTNHEVAHVSAAHDRALLDRLWLEVSAVFNRGYAALDYLDGTGDKDN